MPAHGEGRGTGAPAKLNTFDVTSLVVGSIIGADVYIATAIGVKAAGRVNDVLTIAKLSPLVLIVLGGLAFVAFQPGRFVSNSIPFFTGDLAAFGKALVLIFWAYAGFELSTLPTDEVIEPRKTIPRAIVTGMIIVIGFYFLTNFVVIASVGGSALGGSSSPLIHAPRATFSSPALLTSVIALVVGVGALMSMTGEIGTA